MKKLKNGWVRGSTQEFLELTDADMAYIETKRALDAACLRDQRMKRHLTQTELAAPGWKPVSPCVAKMESGDSTVSIGLCCCKPCIASGTKRRQLAALL